MADLRRRGAGEGMREEEKKDRMETIESTNERRDPVFKFKRVGVLSCKNNILFGATLHQIVGILISMASELSACYCLRASIRSFPFSNTLFTAMPSLKFSWMMSRSLLSVILGQGLGTTLVHNVLSSDPRFSFATNLQVGFPSTFIWMSNFQVDHVSVSNMLICLLSKWLLSFFIDKKRSGSSIRSFADTFQADGQHGPQPFASWCVDLKPNIFMDDIEKGKMRSRPPSCQQV
eukprot:764153-Hanusia_phi.AAC.2